MQSTTDKNTICEMSSITTPEIVAKKSLIVGNKRKFRNLETNEVQILPPRLNKR